MNFLSPAFIPVILVFCVLGILISIIKSLKIFHDRKKRRSPFTANFLRGPGQSLMEKLDDINEDLTTYMTMLFVMPILFYALFVPDIYFNTRPFSVGSALVYVVPGIIIIGFFIYKMVTLLNLRRKIRFGYEGEVATGQELNQMMLHGYHVFHDFLADKFNIDHIVVGPAGVFAVETKARSKPTSDNRKEDAQVTYDGRCLHFPGWREVKPIEQAKNQAVWLERWLSSSTGEKTSVRPVVALPGWFITRTASDGIAVINPRQFISIARPVGGKGLDHAQIKRIVHQLDQRCRNIESKAVNGLGGRN
jgi:hypothetical protein